MRIGIDFDNTIVCYDDLFYRVALEDNLIEPRVPRSKIGVREYLRSINAESDWTRLQGIVYGTRIQEALPYSGVLDFIRRGNQKGHEIFIISHRTKIPSSGMNYDLHEAGFSWLAKHLVSDDSPLVASKNIFFEQEKTAKIDRIRECCCDFFIDDLPEILLTDSFPFSTRKILFDPIGHYEGVYPFIHARSWTDILALISIHDS